MQQAVSADLLPGKEWMLATLFAIKDHNENIRGFDLLNGQTWHLPDGNMWSLSSNDDPSPPETGRL